MWLETISPDALSSGGYIVAGNWELSLGRWGIQFLDTLRGGFVNEVVILFFSFLFLSFSSMLICTIFDLKKKWQMVLVSLLIATAPQFSSTFLFIYCADSYCLSFLLSIFSVYCMTNYDKKKWLLPIGMLAIVLSLSMYQAYIAITITLTILYMLKKLLDSEKIDIKKYIFQFLKYMCIILISMFLYMIITKIILAICNVNFADYKGASGMSITNIINNMFVTIPRTYQDFNQFLFGDRLILNDYWNTNIINILLIILNLICLIYLLIKSKGILIKTIFTIIILIILPLTINLLDIIMPDTQINLVTGPGLICIYIYMILIISLLSDARIIKYIKHLSIILIVILCYTYIMGNNATYFSRNEIYKNYYTISSDIYTRVNSLEGYKYGMKWMFTDNIRYRSKYADMSNTPFASDYETWDNYGGISLTWAFYHRYLGVDLYMVSDDEYFDLIKRDEIAEMPVYPSKDSIKIIDDIVVIKTGYNTYSK